MTTKHSVWHTRYLLSFFPSNTRARYAWNILLRKGVAADVKKLSLKRLKKSLFALESGPS